MSADKFFTLEARSGQRRIFLAKTQHSVVVPLRDICFLIFLNFENIKPQLNSNTADEQIAISPEARLGKTEAGI
jgi:hypothetical protein